jgi:hypothetical protein
VAVQHLVLQRGVQRRAIGANGQDHPHLFKSRNLSRNSDYNLGRFIYPQLNRTRHYWANQKKLGPVHHRGGSPNPFHELSNDDHTYFTSRFDCRNSISNRISPS